MGNRWVRNFFFFGSVEILIFPLFAYSLTDVRRVTPSLPQRGRQHAGSIPLIPLFFGVFINLLMVIALRGGWPGGGSLKA